MRYTLPAVGTAAAVVLTAFLLGSCSEDGNGGGGNPEEVLEGRLETALDYTPGFTDAIDRLVTTINGSPQPGVSITPNGSGYAGTVEVDLDGDGSFETSVSGTLTLNDPPSGLVGGGVLFVTGVEGLSTANGSAAIGVTSETSAYVGNGEFQGTRTGTNPELDVDLHNANMALDVSTGQLVVDGSTEFYYNGVEGLMAFRPAGSGFEIQVSGDGFDPFTVGP